MAATACTLVATAACGASDPGTSGDSPQEGERVVTHAMGETTVSEEPKRVVVLDTGELDSVLALGVKPVGAVAPDATNSLQPYLAEKTKGVPTVGTIGSPNLEKITQLEPDLILSSKVRDEDKYEQLSAIAPTVFAETVGEPWKENFLLNAEALGKKAEGEKILADYKKRAAEIGKKVGNPAETEVSALRTTSGDGTMRLYGEGSFIGTILKDVGFSRPANQRIDKTFTEISREQIGQADGDLLFYSSYGSAAKQRQDELVASSQWSNLGAVRDNKAFEVSDDRWFLGLGPLGANLVLDDLEKIVGNS
ncbi:ABC transporter substrate-binding protein [Parasphingorhabdus pacifica]